MSSVKEVDSQIPCFHCGSSMVFMDTGPDLDVVKLICKSCGKPSSDKPWTRKEYERRIYINEWKEREYRKWYVGVCVPQAPLFTECHYGFVIELIEPDESFEAFKKRIMAKLKAKGYYPCKHNREPSFSKASPWC